MPVVTEVFTNIYNHQLQGIMFHRDMVEYYSFLSLLGLSEIQRCHLLEEIDGNDRLAEYYMRTYHRLLPRSAQHDSPIPSNWFSHTQYDVTASDRQAGVRNGMTAWVEWERKTKSLYTDSYHALLDAHEPSASFVRQYMDDVTDELAEAEALSLHLTAMNYDMPTIVSEQEDISKRYAKKIRGLWR